MDKIKAVKRYCSIVRNRVEMREMLWKMSNGNTDWLNDVWTLVLLYHAEGFDYQTMAYFLEMGFNILRLNDDYKGVGNG